MLPSGSHRTTTTNEPLPLVPVRKRVGMTHFCQEPLVYSLSSNEAACKRWWGLDILALEVVRDTVDAVDTTANTTNNNTVLILIVVLLLLPLLLLIILIIIIIITMIIIIIIPGGHARRCGRR